MLSFAMVSQFGCLLFTCQDGRICRLAYSVNCDQVDLARSDSKQYVLLASFIIWLSLLTSNLSKAHETLKSL